MNKEIKSYKLSLKLAVFMLIFVFSPLYAQEQEAPEETVSEPEPEIIIEQIDEVIEPVFEEEVVIPADAESSGVAKEEVVVPDEIIVEPIVETILSIDQEGNIVIEQVATPTEPETSESELPTETVSEPQSASTSEPVATGTEPVLPLETADDTASSQPPLVLSSESEVPKQPTATTGEPSVLSAEADISEEELVETSYLVSTGIIRLPVFNDPTVIAQWQMSAPIPGIIVGRDDSTAVGAQLLPSGGYQINRSYSICALVAAGSGEIESAMATVNYPENIALGTDEANRGCGRLKSFFDLEKLEQAEATDLFCDNIRIYNNNLISWNKDQVSNYTYSYEQVCGEEGLLNSGKAVLFCGEDKLFYDDPAGDYQVAVSIKDNDDKADTSYNTLKYLELTMFEADFSDFQYGLVEEMNWKIVLGDTVWEDSSAPTVRNIGNTRLNIIVNQNDFGFGRTDEEWNISYRSRLGNITQFTTYIPEISKIIEDPINLGESVKMDFAVFVKRFPNEPIPDFSGQMTLSAEKAGPLDCVLP